MSNPYTQERFEEFLALLEKHLVTHKQVSQYTDLMSLSPYQLNEITKSSVGKTASESMNRLSWRPKDTSWATPNQVKDIADLLGYEDFSYFIRFFKKHNQDFPRSLPAKFQINPVQLQHCPTLSPAAAFNFVGINFKIHKNENDHCWCIRHHGQTPDHRV